MNLWASKKLLNAGIIVALFATLTSVGFLNAPVYADAVSGTTGSPGISELSDRWLRYRAVAGCYASTDIGKMSIDKITAGTWFQKSDLDYNVATGYTTGGDDRKVSCGDGAFVTNSLQQIGFSSNIDSFCSMSTALRGDSKDDARCINGPGEFDMDGSKTDQFDAFKDAKGAKVSDSPLFPYSINDAGTKKILYWVGRQTLIDACGGAKGEAYVDSMQGNVRDSKRKVVVNEVNLATGEVERFVYNLDKDEGDTIDDVWSETGGGSASGNINSKDMTCTELAQLTWENDTAFGTFVNAYNTANPDDTGTSTPEENPAGSSEPVCSAGMLGWVICPLTDFISDATQTIAGIIEDQLVYPPLLDSDQGDAIRTVWGTVLGIANLGLVLAFLIIIFSQATSVGLSSYGIKKILPRLIAAAILMNLSFFLCAIAVDLANILGVSIKGIVQAGIESIDKASPASDLVSADGTSWAAGVVGILGLGVAAFTGTIAFLLPVILSALIAVFVAFLVIAARGIIVTLLIIVAPLAFLAWILPNTEQWFTKWRKLFTTMLLLFPLVMLVFYGSLLVSRLVLVTTAGGGDGDPKVMTNIIALAILTVPLFSLPFIMKSAGGVLDRFGVLVNNRGKGLVDRSRKAAKTAQQHSRFSNAVAYRRENRELDRVKRRGKNTAFNRAMRPAGGEGYAAYTQRRRDSLEDKEFEQAVSDAATGQKNTSFPSLKAIAKDPNATEYERVAAARSIMAKGNFEDRKVLYDHIDAKSSARMRQTVSEQFYAKGDSQILGSAFGGQLLEGKSGGDPGARLAAAEYIKSGKVTPQALVQDSGATDLLLDVAQNASTYGINQQHLDGLAKSANETMTNEATKVKAAAPIYSSPLSSISKLGSTPPPSAPGSGGPGPQPPLPPGAAGGFSGSTGSGGLWTPTPRSGGTPPSGSGPTSGGTPPTPPPNQGNTP